MKIRENKIMLNLNLQALQILLQKSHIDYLSYRNEQNNEIVSVEIYVNSHLTIVNDYKDNELVDVTYFNF